MLKNFYKNYSKTKNQDYGKNSCAKYGGDSHQY